MALRILHVGKFYPPYAGGMENILKDVCDGLAANEQDVRVICSSNDKSSIVETIEGVEVFRYGILVKLSSQVINPKMYFDLIKHIGWADIIHVHTPNPLLEFLVSLLVGKKVFVSTHHSDIYRQKFLKRIYMPFWKYFLRKVTKITAPTKNHLEYSDMIKSVPDKVVIIPFGLKTEKFKGVVGEALSLSLDEKYFLSVGRLVEYKGLEYLIAAMKEVKSKLYIVGRGPLKDHLLSQIEKHDVGHKVKVLTNVGDSGLCEMYENAYGFVLPSISKNENFGIVQLEAMYFSLPVITTNIQSGVPAVGIPGETTILVDPCSVHELANALMQLENNEEQAKEMGRKGRALFELQYKYDTMIESHLNLYRKLYDEK